MTHTLTHTGEKALSFAVQSIPVFPVFQQIKPENRGAGGVFPPPTPFFAFTGSVP
jgi:hypothetical protein